MSVDRTNIIKKTPFVFENVLHTIRIQFDNWLFFKYRTADFEILEWNTSKCFLRPVILFESYSLIRIRLSTFGSAHIATLLKGGGIFRISFLKARVSNSKNAKHKTNIETQMYFFMYLIFVRIELLWRLFMSFVIRNFFFYLFIPFPPSIDMELGF